MDQESDDGFSDTSFTCDVTTCDEIFTSIREKVKHIHQVHRLHLILYPQGGGCSSKLIHKCPECKIEVLTKDRFKHEFGCYRKEGDSFKCSDPSCEMLFRTLESRNNHIAREHELPIPCDFKGCREEIKPIHMNAHMKQAHNPRVACENCGKKMLIKLLPKHKTMCPDKNVEDSDSSKSGGSRKLSVSSNTSESSKSSESEKSSTKSSKINGSTKSTE